PPALDAFQQAEMAMLAARADARRRGRARNARGRLMLKGLDPLLSADLLHALRAMGHGDEIVIVDANFPAASNARRLIRLDGVDAPRALAAILSVLPLDSFVDDPLKVMAVVGDAAKVPEVVREIGRVASQATGREQRLAAVAREA